MKHLKTILWILLLSVLATRHFAVKADTPIVSDIYLDLTETPNNGTIKMSASNSDNEFLVFGYCRDYSTSLGAGQSHLLMDGAIRIPASTAQQYKGKKLSKIYIGYGKSSVSHITVYLTENLYSKAFYSQEATMTTNGGWNEVVLATPYTIDGNAFYIGYQTAINSSTDYPIGVDGQPTTNPNACFVGIGGSFTGYGSSYGSLCIKGVIEGEDLPQHHASILGGDIPSYVGQGAPFSISLAVSNLGVKTLEDIEVSCKIGDTVLTGLDVSLSPINIKSGEVGDITVTGLKYDNIGSNIPLKITIDKINGYTAGKEADNTYSATITCLEKVFKQNAVVEEFTGTWCGWCVRGIVGMEYMKKNYDYDGFIGITVHNADPMAFSAYQTIIDTFGGSGFPAATINRSKTFDPSPQALESYYNQFTRHPALSEVTITKAISRWEGEDSKTAVFDVEASAEFSLDQANAKYAFAFVVTEDNVGPYSQTNSYSGGANGSMNGWGSLGSSVPTMYNDVARLIETPYGVTGSIPSEIKRNTPYPYSITLKSTNISDIKNCEIIALLLDTSSKKIMNAAKVKLGNSSLDDSGLLNKPDLEIHGIQEAIMVKGEYKNCMIYGIDGSTVQFASGDDLISVPAGLYIVQVTTTNGNRVIKKVQVR